jgi:hypothetical protein
MAKKRDYNFRSIEETIYLRTKGNHQNGKCLEGDIFAQIKSPDLKPDEFFNARVCNVCGTPFVDGFSVAKRNTGLDLYIARSSELENGLNHFHLTTEDGKISGNDYLNIMYIQPNNFLKCYSPNNEVLHIFNPTQRAAQKAMVESMSKNPRFKDDSIMLMVTKELTEALGGHHVLTPGEVVLRTLYGTYYESMKPLSPRLLELIKETMGKEAFDIIKNEIKNANNVPENKGIL